MNLIDSALQELRYEGVTSPILQRPTEFFEEEIQWIQQHGIVDNQQYIEGERIGRSTARVRRADRPIVYNVYLRYLHLRNNSGKNYDWYDMASAVRRELPLDNEERRYRHVIIDEGSGFLT